MRKFCQRLAGATIFIVGVLCSPSLASNSWDSDKRYAVIVGINNYDNAAVTDLNCATEDARLFKKSLIEQANFVPDNIFLFTSDSNKDSEKPYLTNLVFRLEWLRDIVNPGDTLVFYFAGHGVSLDSKTFLLTQEADQRSKNTLMVSSLPGDVLNELLKAAGAQNTLVFLDACRNDPTSGSRSTSDNLLTDTMSRGLVFKPTPSAARELSRNTATIFACEEGQRSWEWTDKHQGFFTYFLAQGLQAQSGAYDQAGNLTLQGLVNFLGSKVNAAALRETNNPQKPMVRYEGSSPDHWVIAHDIASANSNNDRLAQLSRAQLVAEVQAKELEARQNQYKVNIAEAGRAVAVAESDLIKAQATASHSDPQIEAAKLNLKIALANQSAVKERGGAVDWSINEALARVETAKIAQQVYGSHQDTADASALNEKLNSLQRQLDELAIEKKAAVERALKAERKVRELTRDPFNQSSLPTRSTRPSDLLRFDNTAEGSEAESF